MPATYTHHLFAEDVAKNIPKDIQKKLKKSKDIYYLFSKSFDILYFTKKSKLGHHAHSNNVNAYFENIINSIIEHNLTNDSDTLAYLYGSICHYALDSIAHPYIFYKTGIYRKTKETKKYKGLHSYYEYMLDAILYQERNNKPIYKASLAKELFKPIKFSQNLNNVINDAFNNTFNEDNIAYFFKTGRYIYKFMIRNVMTSRFGIKKFFYKIIDKPNIFKNYEFHNLCYHIKKLDCSVLNSNHNKWYYPCDLTISSNHSFYNLYDIALQKAQKLISITNDYLTNPKSQNLANILKEYGNIGYSSGIDCNIKRRMTNFEF